MMRVTRRWAALGLGAALAGAAGCGTDVAQTAVLVNETTPVRLDCTAPATPPELPSDPSLGGGTTITPWVLAKGEYDVDQGPGVVVAARDGFRLFVNGHLLATGTASLVPTFVPLTLLPGDNAVSVVVTPVSGPAALLARVDELERPYVSDASWKVSHDPTGDWSDAGYDDSG
ncbi:MAG TPA: hypothetical protein VGQ57_07345, partial [Polyangiaceae bacterium]|nr:hypothetical protein [Polyangiaceae bacterium]